MDCHAYCHYPDTGGAIQMPHANCDSSRCRGQLMITTVGFAGDGLLWKVDSAATGVRDRFRALLAEYDTPAGVEAQLADTWTSNLDFYGFGVKAYTLSMIETAITVTDGKVSTADIATIVSFGKEMAGSPVQLTDWARPTVVSLTDRYRLLLLAQGDLFDQESRVARSGLAELFWRIDVVREKDDPTYRRILDRHHIDPAEFVMVGSNQRSDVEPVVSIGATAVYVPTEPSWEEELGVWSAGDLSATGVHEISSLGDLPEVLARL